MKRTISLILTLLLLTAMFTSCAAPSSSPQSSTTVATTSATETSTSVESSVPAPEKTKINVAALKGPTAIGLVNLIDAAEKGEALNEYDFKLSATADEIVPLIAKGEIDIACIPANLSSILYKNTKQISVIAINTLGVLYVVETGETISSVADLKGKTLYTTGKGTTPEFALRYILKMSGIDFDTDLEVIFKSEANEVVAVLSQDPGAIGLLPQPLVATLQTKNPAVRTALDLSAEWDNLQTGENKSALVTGVTVVRTAFLQENPEAVAVFMQEYEQSINAVNANPAEGAKLVAALGIVPSPEIAEKAIPQCNISFIAGLDMKEKLSGYLAALFEQEPASVGGELPDDQFYFAE